MSKKLSGITLATALLPMAAAIMSNSASAVESDKGKTSASIFLEEVIVTAQRRGESIQDVPIAITAFTGEQLKAAGINRTSDLTQVTPGLQLNTIATNGQAFMRGVGTSNLGGNVEGSVAYYVDDIYYADPAGVLMSLNNIERVEVLKGPQGTLFGRNATGGLIHVITPDPEADGYVRAQVGYESYNTLTSSIYATGGTETLRASLAVTYHDQDEGFGDNLTRREDANYIRNEGYRGKVLWLPTENDRVTFMASYYEDTTDMSALQMTPKGMINAFGTPYSGDPYDALQDTDPDPRTKAHDASIRWEHSFDNGMEFKSITAYRESEFAINVDVDFGPLPIGTNELYKGTESIQQEFLLQGSTDRIDWTAGLFYIHTETEFTPVINATVPFPPFSIVQNRFASLELDSYAVFGQVDFRLTERDTLTLGLRYTKDEQAIEGEWIAPTPFGPITVPGTTVDDDTSFEEPTWRLAYKHEFDNDMMVYASYNRGYKSGVFNSTPPYAVVDPEFLDAYEIGLKGNFADGRLQLDVNAFYNDFEDMQLLLIVNNIADITNAAKAEIYGLEANAVWSVPVPVGDLVIRTNIGVMESEFKDYDGCKIVTPNFPLPGNTVNNNGDCSGNSLPHTPDFTANLGVNYMFPVGDAGGEMGIGVNYSHNDGVYYLSDNVLKQDSYGLVSAEVSYQFPDGKTAVRVYGRNLTDEDVSVFTGNDASYNSNPIAPRIFGIEFSYLWD